MKNLIALPLMALLCSFYASAEPTVFGPGPILPVSTVGNASSFRSIINEAQSICQDLTCANSGVRVHSLSRYELKMINPKLVQTLVHIADDIAQTEWPETILEGPYVAAFHVGMQELDLLYKQNVFIGYRLTYEDHGWEIDGCKYNPQLPNTLGLCLPGLFVEDAFVAADLHEYFRDPKNFVEFHPGGDPSVTANPNL